MWAAHARDESSARVRAGRSETRIETRRVTSEHVRVPKRRAPRLRFGSILPLRLRPGLGYARRPLRNLAGHVARGLGTSVATGERCNELLAFTASACAACSARRHGRFGRPARGDRRVWSARARRFGDGPARRRRHDQGRRRGHASQRRGRDRRRRDRRRRDRRRRDRRRRVVRDRSAQGWRREQMGLPARLRRGAHLRAALRTQEIASWTSRTRATAAAAVLSPTVAVAHEGVPFRRRRHRRDPSRDRRRSRRCRS